MHFLAERSKFSGGVIYVNFNGVKTPQQMLLKLHQVFVKDIDIFSKIDDPNQAAQLDFNLSGKLDSFMDFLIAFLENRRYPLKLNKHFDDKGSHDMKFLLCFQNVTELYEGHQEDFMKFV